MRRFKKSLYEDRPDVASLWHPTKNRELDPENVSSFSRVNAWWRCVPGSTLRAWWICKNGHSEHEQVRYRVRRGCCCKCKKENKLLLKKQRQG